MHTAAYGYTASTVGSIPNSDIVDWVLVELRTGTASDTKVAERAAFLKSDGTIVDTDGSSPVTFSGLSDGNYYVVIQTSKSSCNYDCISNCIKRAVLHYMILLHLNHKLMEQIQWIVLTGGGFGMIAADGNKDGGIYGEDYILYQYFTG